MKKFTQNLAFSLLASTLFFTACSTTNPPSQPPTKDDLRAEAKRLGEQKNLKIVPDDPNCVNGEMGSRKIRFRTCLVHAIQPSGFHNEEFGPRLATVVETPYGTVGNPMAWTVEVRKNGELIVRQALTNAENKAIEREGSLEIETSIPLGELQEIEPGDYEVIYTPDEEDAEPVRSLIHIDENKEIEEIKAPEPIETTD